MCPLYSISCFYNFLIRNVYLHAQYFFLIICALRDTFISVYFFEYSDSSNLQASVIRFVIDSHPTRLVILRS